MHLFAYLNYKMTNNTPKKKPGRLSDKAVETHVLTRDRILAERRAKRKELLRDIKINMNRMTLGARDKGGDISSLRQKRFEDLIDKKLAEQQKATLDKITDMFATYDSREDYAKFLQRVKDFVDRSDKDLVRLQQAILYTMRCVAGYDGKIEVGDYAYFYSILDNISALYGKNVKIGETIVRIQKDNIVEKDWDVICRNIKSKKLTRTATSAKDELRLSTSAFLIQLMNPHQKTQLILEFYKRYGASHATELAEQMVETGAISLKQHEVVMTKITGAKYVRTAQEEKFIRERRHQAQMFTKRIRENLQRPLAINAAERLLNRKSIGSLVVTGIGVLGMITNYMAGLNTGKGIGKYFKGLKSPYFLLSMGVTAGGYHMLTGSMHPGKSVGALDKLIGKPRRLDNPFGTTGIAEKQDAQMKYLAQVCADHQVWEDWLLRNKGFDDIWGFYSKKRFDRTKLKSQLLTTKQRAAIKGAKRKGLYEEFLEYVEKERGNKRGAARLREAKRLYGKATVERMLFDTTIAAHTLGINSTAGFYRKSTQQNVKYNDVFLYRQGIKPRPQAMRMKPKKTKKSK